MSEDSYIGVNKGRTTTFVGPDAVNLYRAVVLNSSLKLWAKTKITPSRGITISKMLQLAASYTGKTYKRSQAGALLAAEDVQVWVDTMKAALPVVCDD